MARPIGPKEVPAFTRFCHEEPPRKVNAHILPGKLLDLSIERDRVRLQARYSWITVECMKPAGCMPARTCRELLALTQHHVAPAELSEVIQNTAANDTSADYDNLRVRFHKDCLELHSDGAGFGKVQPSTQG